MRNMFDCVHGTEKKFVYSSKFSVPVMTGQQKIICTVPKPNEVAKFATVNVICHIKANTHLLNKYVCQIQIG